MSDVSFADPGTDRDHCDAKVTIDIATLAIGDELVLPCPVGMRFGAPARLMVEADGAPRAWLRITSTDFDKETGILTAEVLEISDDIGDLEVTEFAVWNVFVWDFGGALTVRQAFSNDTPYVMQVGVIEFPNVQAGKQFPVGASVDLLATRRRRLAALARVIYYTDETLRVKIEKASDITGNSPNPVIATANYDGPGSVEIVNPGSGYEYGDTITLANGTVLTNTSHTDPYDTVTEVEITTPGDWATLPSNPVSQVSTSGVGTGATFNVTTAIQQTECLIELIDRAPPGVPLGQISGLRVTRNASDPTNDIDISPGEIRDSTDTVDLVLPAAVTKRLDALFAAGTNQGAQVQSANLAGTISSVGAAVTGTGTAFETDFSDDSTAVTLGSTGIFWHSVVQASNGNMGTVKAVISNTSLTAGSALGATNLTYKRGGWHPSDLVRYVIILTRNDATGVCEVQSSTVNAAGVPDREAGYTLYGIIAYVFCVAGIWHIQNVVDAEFIADAKASLTVPVVLDRDTFAAAATVDVFFPAGHENFRKLVGEFSFVPGTDLAELFLRLSTAAAFLSGVADYRWWHEFRNGTTGAVTLTVDNSDSEIEIALNVGNLAAEGGNLTITIRKHANASRQPVVYSEGDYVNGTAAQNNYTIGVGEFRGAAQSTDGIQLLPSTGTISGSWTLTASPE